jgi:cell shape-determining protein MreC
MEVEVFTEELKAVRRWNCAQLIKRRQRAVISRLFFQWKREGMATQTIRSERENSIHQSRLAQRNESKQSTSQLANLNAQLRRDLARLQAEQRDLESATGQIREELRGLSTSSSFQTSPYRRSPLSRH